VPRSRTKTSRSFLAFAREAIRNCFSAPFDSAQKVWHTAIRISLVIVAKHDLQKLTPAILTYVESETSALMITVAEKVCADRRGFTVWPERANPRVALYPEGRRRFEELYFLWTKHEFSIVVISNRPLPSFPLHIPISDVCPSFRRNSEFQLAQTSRVGDYLHCGDFPFPDCATDGDP